VNVAQHVREHLSASRTAGVDFADAWPAAMAEIMPPVRGHPSTTVARERRAWTAAFASTRAAWQDAYHRVPESRAEAAARALEELVAA
jgi:hypothetical protein